VPPSNGSAAESPRARRFGLFELDLRAGELRRSGIKVKLQEQPFQILTLLLERPGEVVTREDLRNRLWPADTFVDFDHSLNAAIKRLRDALGDSAENPTFVETVARRGYRFLAPVTTTFGDGAITTAQPSSPDIPVAMPAAKPARHFHLWSIAAAAGLALILFGIKLGLSLASHHTVVQAQPRISRLTANPADDRVRAAAISRDRRYLAFADETGFYLRQIDTGETHSLALPKNMRPDSISWFPDSVHMIAAVSVPDQDSDLWEISALSGESRRLFDHGRLPSVSPDGSQVAFVTGMSMDESVWIMGSDGSQARKLVGKPGNFFGSVAWSPDGTTIAYTRGTFSHSWGVKGTIELLNLHDGRVSGLLDLHDLGFFLFLQAPLAWAPDGHVICSLGEPPPRQLDSNLWSLTLDDQKKIRGAPQRLTSDSGAVTSISTSGDGQRIIYVKGIPQPDVYVAKLDGRNLISEPKRLTLDDRQDLPFDWTLDGHTVIFISDRTGVFNAYRQDIDQPVPDVLIGGNRPIFTPRLSPDGTQIIYLADTDWTGKPPSATLMSMPIAGGAPHRIVRASWFSNQQCARAPATLCLYSVVGDGQLTLFRFDPTDGPGAQVYQIKDDLPEYYNWTLSPDGTMLATAKSKANEGSPQIHLIFLNSNAEKWLTVEGLPAVSALDWAADSRSLWVTSAGEQENSLLNVDLQGRSRVVWRPSKMMVKWAIPSRDGRSLALHVTSSSANVWMLERQ